MGMKYLSSKVPEEAKSGGEKKAKTKKTKSKAPMQGEQEETPQYRDYLRMKMLR